VEKGTYLFLAVEKGHVEVARSLLEVGGCELVMMTRNDDDQERVSCLWISAANGDLEVVKALLEVCKKIVVSSTNPFSTKSQKILKKTHMNLIIFFTTSSNIKKSLTVSVRVFF
jgi:hypothetical protein